MDAHALVAELERRASARGDLTVSRHALIYRSGTHDLLQLSSRDLRPGDRIMLIQAGIHGDEIAGPITFLHHFDRVIDAVHRRGLKLVCFPLANPSAYAGGTRYNGDGDR